MKSGRRFARTEDAALELRWLAPLTKSAYVPRAGVLERCLLLAFDESVNSLGAMSLDPTPGLGFNSDGHDIFSSVRRWDIVRVGGFGGFESCLDSLNSEGAEGISKGAASLTCASC